LTHHPVGDKVTDTEGNRVSSLRPTATAETVPSAGAPATRRTSEFREARARGRRLLRAALFLAAAAISVPAGASESVVLTVEEAGEELFLELTPDGEPLRPEKGKAACVGRFDRLSVKDVSQVTVTGPDGKRLPLVIEASSIFVEFDKIVALRFCFLVDADRARPGEDSFTFQWGPDVRASNTKVERLVLDSALRASYRSLRQRTASGARDSTTASITVIADSSADYHFLWYLLPISLIFAVLTARKLMVRSQAAGGGETGGDPVSRTPR
jgi:hypothetical protein